MLPKTKKKTGGDLIALGPRQKDSQSSTNNISNSGEVASATATALNMAFGQTVSSNNVSNSSQLSNNRQVSSLSSATSTSLQQQQPSQVSSGSEVTKNGNKTTSNSLNSNSNNSNYLDPKTIKDEINKLIEKDETEKLIKLIRLIVTNLKFPNPAPSSNSTVKMLQPPAVSQQQPDLNFLLALSVVSVKRPELFLRQPALVDLICTSLLFTSKHSNQQDKLNVANSSILKSKSIQMIRNSMNQTGSISSIQPAICQLLYKLFENESVWPEIFIKAYVDDSLGERTWVDNSACQEFVKNTLTAFCTKPLPFSVDSSTITSSTGNNVSSNNNEHLSSSVNNQNNPKFEPNSLTETNGADELNIKFKLIPRYSSMRNEIEVLIVDTIKQFSNKQPPSQRLIGQSNLQPAALGSSMENKNFLKLLQNSCGICEVRALASSKLDAWLAVPKLTSTAQDLLMAVCVNVNCQLEQADKEIIAQVIKLKPKLKQHQHYYDCIRELVRNNPSNFETLIQLLVLNDLNMQQQHYLQYNNQLSQIQQQQQIPPNRNQHNLNIFQTTFSTDGRQASKILAEIMQKIFLQRNNEDLVRPLRSLLRDTIKNSRQDFDLIEFTHGLLNLSVPLIDLNQVQLRERYVNGICDLISVCVLVAITPQIKEAYMRRQHETKDILIKYYMLMAQIQRDTIIWLHDVVFNVYKVNSNFLINCMFKILFMVDKPEQCYSIDNWPSEQERGIMFKVVSEIPVLFETLLQVLMITKSLPDNMFMLMLCVEENLLKQAALVNNKDISSLHIKSMDSFIELLFSICLYTFQNPPTVSLAVTVLYWKAWQILLIIAALDPKGFGLVAWEKYPTLRLLMEMTMTEDYNFPPQSSICDEFTCERYRTIEITASANEKKEILEFENFFELKQSSKIIRTELNSNLIDKVMKFDPTGQVRRPTNETIQNIKKLNSEYKLGQLLCKSRQPDFLLSLIKRQNSTLSLPWLSSLIESSSNDCLEIMPIQCICEFVWNMLGGVDEIQLKKQINIEQLIQRLRMILTTSSLNDSLKISQINDTFDYFLNKLSSEKQAVRIGSLKILQKLLTNEKIQLQPNLSTIQIDLKEIIGSIKNLAAFNIYLQPLMIKHFRRALMVETNSCYLNVYTCFIFEQLIDDYQQKSELESSLQMQIETATESAESTPILIKNGSLKSTFNEIAVDLSSFFFSRPNLLDSIIGTSASAGQDEKKFYNYFAKFSSILINLNEYNIDECDENDNLNIKTLIRVNQTFDRNSTATNSFILIEISSNHYTYIHEKIFNLVLYLVFFVIESTSLDSKRPGEYKVKELENLFKTEFFARFSQIKFMNCSIMSALNEKVKNKIFSLKIKPLGQIQPDNLSLKFAYEALELLIDSFSSEEISVENRLHQSLEYLLKRNGISVLSIHLMLKKIDLILKDNISKFNEIISNFCNITGYTVNYIVDLIELSEKKTKESQYPDAGQILLSELKKIKEKFSLVKLPIRKPDNLFNDYESLFRLKNDSKQKQLDNHFSNKIDNELRQTSYSIEFLNTIQKQINELKDKYINEDSEAQQMQVEESPDKQDLSDKLNDQLISQIVANSSNQNLETNLKNHLNTISSTSEKINLIADWLLNLENTEIQISSKRNEIFSKNQSVIVILLDYFCHLDPQVISADDPKQYQILFVSREKGNSSTMTQFFLLSLFIHQGDWQKLHSCVLYLLSQNLNEKMDPSIVLDFLSSLIHIPELWKGTESKVSQKYNEENILNLTENQICRLIDFIVQEMCLNYAHKHDETQEKFSQINELKFKLNKRVQLLKHFFKSFHNNKKQKEILITKIIRHLDEQKHNFVSQNNNMLSEKFYTQIQNFFLYSIYLEENSIINHIKNPHRLFSNLYYQIDIPTKLDVIAHNLLNCFGEIEVNFSMNATSSGRIGVASSVTNFKKQEKLEIVAYAKKQEEFMMDANLVCIKLASSHPFIFIRQIPMMEGLLQGRVVYTYEEFKKRKFDKLFHYIIDLLNVLVPYVFHREYLLYIEPIISHYFDVFRSYCSENRDANGSLIQKFFEFLEKFINTDFQTGFNLIFKKYSSLISYLNKLYSDISSIKFINAILTIPFELILNKNNPTNDVNDNSILTDNQLISTSSVNIFNQKFLTSIWPTKQLEPFTSKLLNRENYDGVYSVLQEIDTVSQRQPVLLSHFIFQLQPFMLDINDNIRDCSISLIMRYLRLNPRDSSAFFQVFSECLISQDSKVFNSAIKIFSDFIVLCSEKSNQLFRYALKGASKHNVDISKALSDSIRLLNLEKYVY